MIPTSVREGKAFVPLRNFESGIRSLGFDTIPEMGFRYRLNDA